MITNLRFKIFSWPAWSAAVSSLFVFATLMKVSIANPLYATLLNDKPLVVTIYNNHNKQQHKWVCWWGIMFGKVTTKNNAQIYDKINLESKR